MPRIKFTKSAIDALPASDVDVVYWDTGCPGFGLKVTPKGRKVFTVLYRKRSATLAAAGVFHVKRTIRPEPVLASMTTMQSWTNLLGDVLLRCG